MSVYDPEKTEDKRLTSSGADNNWDSYKDPLDRANRQKHNPTPQDILDAENRGESLKPSSTASKDELRRLRDNSQSDVSRFANNGDDTLDKSMASTGNEDGSSFFNKHKDTIKNKSKWKLTKKQAAGGVAGVLGIGAIGGIMMTASGPLAFIHMANLMKPFHHDNGSNMQDGRLTRLWRYARGDGINNNLGAIGNRYADKVDARMKDLGITPNYNNRVLTSFTFDTDTPKGKDAFDKLVAKGYVPNEIDVDGSAGSGRYMQIDAARGFGSRNSIRTMGDDLRIALSEDGISNAITHRLAKKRYAGGFHPLQNFYREAGESIVDYMKSVKQHHDDRVKTGVPDPDRPKPARTQDEIDADTRDNLRRNTPDGISDDTPSGVKSKIIGAVAGTVGAVGLYELICNIDQVGRSMEAIRQAEIIEPLMRIGLDGLAFGSQIQFGGQDVTSDEMGAIFTRFMGDTDIGKLSAFSADSIQAELGKEQIGERTATQGENTGKRVKPADLPASSKPGKENPAMFDVINGIISALPGGRDACDVLIDLNACVGSACIGVSDVLDGVVAFVSGGASSAAANATVNAIFIGAGVLASDYIDSLIHWLAGAALQCADGPQWGSCVNFGNRLNANDNALSFGGRELQPEEEVALDNTRKELERYDMKSKSLYARYLDPKETNSLFASAIFNNPNYVANSASLSYGLQAPLKNFSNIFSNFGSLFGGQAKAASPVNYDYGFPEYGFSVNEQLDASFENPYSIATWVEEELPEDRQCSGGTKRLDCLNKDYGECFNTTINSATGKIQTTKAVDYREIPDICDDDNPRLKKYRFYIADMITAKSAVCYEGEDESACAELGLDNESEGGPGANGPLPDGTVTEEDIEPVTGLTSGCHKSIAANANAMIAAAAADGVTLTGSCWRSNARQIQLRQINGCPDIYTAPPSSCRVPTAIPGTSNHEKGLAIDFDNCRIRSTACFQWLAANAATYGFYNLPSEPWHWSVDGR